MAEWKHPLFAEEKSEHLDRRRRPASPRGQLKSGPSVVSPAGPTTVCRREASRKQETRVFVYSGCVLQNNECVCVCRLGPNMAPANEEAAAAQSVLAPPNTRNRSPGVQSGAGNPTPMLQQKAFVPPSPTTTPAPRLKSSVPAIKELRLC